MATVAALAACGGGSDSPAAAPAPPPPPVQAPAPAPGTLVSHAPLAASRGLADAGDQRSIVYTSTEGVSGNGLVNTTGAVFFPRGTAPAGGWPVIAWAHGTVGLGDTCAPSVNARSARDAEYLNTWLREGFVVVATDYQGLGSPGAHVYLHARAQAYALLDSVRAVLTLPDVANRVILLGQSQGGGAVFATAGYAAAYAPELSVRGTVATGTPHTARRNASPYSPDAVNPTLAYTMYLARAGQQLDPTLAATDIFSARALPAYAGAAEQCAGPLANAVSTAGLTNNNVFATTDSVTRLNNAVREAVRYPTYVLPQPLFMGIGALDQSISAEQQVALATDACRAGSQVVHRVYAGAGHDSAVSASLVDSLPFVRQVLAGGAVNSTCASLLAS